MFTVKEDCREKSSLREKLFLFNIFSHLLISVELGNLLINSPSALKIIEENLSVGSSKTKTIY